MEGRITSLLFSNTFKGKQTLQLISVLMLKELSTAWKNEREATDHVTSSLLNLMKRTPFSGYRVLIWGKKKDLNLFLLQFHI